MIHFPHLQFTHTHTLLIMQSVAHIIGTATFIFNCIYVNTPYVFYRNICTYIIFISRHFKFIFLFLFFFILIVDFVVMVYVRAWWWFIIIIIIILYYKLQTLVRIKKNGLKTDRKGREYKLSFLNIKLETKKIYIDITITSFVLIHVCVCCNLCEKYFLTAIIFEGQSN